MLLLGCCKYVQHNIIEKTVLFSIFVRTCLSIINMLHLVVGMGGGRFKGFSLMFIELYEIL